MATFMVYLTNEKGNRPKTEANALALRDSLVNMPKRENIVWFDNGMIPRWNQARL
jgi:hypothetical protein